MRFGFEEGTSGSCAPRQYLLLHLLDFFDRASPDMFLFKLDIGGGVGGARGLLVLLLHWLPNLLLLLLLCLLQLALGTDAVSIVHVVSFHHLQRTKHDTQGPARQGWNTWTRKKPTQGNFPRQKSRAGGAWASVALKCEIQVGDAAAAALFGFGVCQERRHENQK